MRCSAAVEGIIEVTPFSACSSELFFSDSRWAISWVAVSQLTFGSAPKLAPLAARREQRTAMVAGDEIFIDLFSEDDQRTDPPTFVVVSY
jgi:hypothetical protein